MASCRVMERALPARVLHVHSGNLYGGVETTLRTIAQHQRQVAGPEHQFSYCFEGRFSEELRAEKATMYRLPETRIRFPWTLQQARQELFHVITREHIDIVICHMPWALALFGSVSQRAGALLVFWAHQIHRGDYWLERWAGRRNPSLVLVNSEVTASGVERIFPSLSSQLLHYPVAPPLKLGATGRAAKRAELGVNDRQTVILQVSRLERWKGQHLLLRALSTFRDRDDWVCWIVGGAQRREEEQYLAELHQETATLGLASRVKFIGQRSDVGELMQAADIFCQPNEGPEPFGIVFVEALGAGLPIVTFAMGGATEIVDHTCGLLSKPGDMQGLSHHLRTLVENPALRQTLGERGPARASQVSDPETQLALLAHFLNEAYQSGSSSRHGWS